MCLLLRAYLAAGASKVRPDDRVCLAGGIVFVDIPVVGSLLRRKRNCKQRSWCRNNPCRDDAGGQG